jgi:hypothetical protein
MTISKTKAQAMIDELSPVVKEIMARHGMDPKFAWKYGDWFEMKMTASAVEEGPNGVNLNSPEAQYFSRFGFTSYALSQVLQLSAPLGTLFTSKGKTYAFAGIAAKRSKYPIVGRNVADGSITFFTEVAVLEINKAAAPAAV